MSLCLVADGAVLRCTAGGSPALLRVARDRATHIAGARAATVADHLPGAHVPSFGDCRAGAVTQPCVPGTPTPWSTGATSCRIGDVAMLDAASRLACERGGTVLVALPMDAGVRHG